MDTALLAIDVQEGLLAERPWNATGMLENIRALMAWARESGAPIVLVRDRRVEPGFALVCRTGSWQTVRCAKAPSSALRKLETLLFQRFLALI